jgi:hypothetical protein
MPWQNVFAAFLEAGNTVIINSSGLIVYDGPPAAGNLLASIAPNAYIDSYGNHVYGGINIYGENNASIDLYVSGTQPVIFFNPPLTNAHVTTAGDIFSTIINVGLANEYLILTLTSGKENSLADAGLQLFSEAADGSQQAMAVIEFGGTVFCTITSTGLILPGVSTAPAAVPGSTLIFGTQPGSLGVVDGVDSQQYATQRRSLYLNANSGNSSTSFATFLSSTVAAPSTNSRAYRIHGLAYWEANQTGGQFAAQWIGPGATAGLIEFTWQEGTTVATIGGKSNGSSGNPSITMSNGTVYIVKYDGIIIVPAGVSGTFALQYANVTAGDTFFVVQNTFVDIMPV